MNPFPSPFSWVIILIVDEKVKTLKYRVNAGTYSCATHSLVLVRLDDAARLAVSPDTGREMVVAQLFAAEHA